MKYKIQISLPYVFLFLKYVIICYKQSFSFFSLSLKSCKLRPGVEDRERHRYIYSMAKLSRLRLVKVQRGHSEKTGIY